MRVMAPGKVMLSGAYAVLQGAPSVLLAVDRYAVAATRRGKTTAAVPEEVRVAFAGEAPPTVDVGQLHSEGSKLGLGSSAAALVAALAVRAELRGSDLRHQGVRTGLFWEARSVHCSVQGGGSGADIAASVFGGVTGFRLRAGGVPEIVPLALPARLHLAFFWTGVPARTSDLLARVKEAQAASPAQLDVVMQSLATAAELFTAALKECDVEAAIALHVQAHYWLCQLSRFAAGAVMPERVCKVAEAAQQEGASLSLAGAGGGDMAVYMGLCPPSEAVLEVAANCGLQRVHLRTDTKGVRRCQ